MRAFFCVELEREVREELAKWAAPLRQTGARATWVKPENLHITLKFLGEIDIALIPELQKAASQVAQSLSPSDLTLDRWGVFPDLRRPRVLWVGPTVPPAALVGLHSQLEPRLARLGFARERDFTVHVTLGRVKDESSPPISRLIDALRQRSPLRVASKVSAVTLMESRLSPEGAVYYPLFRVPFGA